MFPLTFITWEVMYTNHARVSPNLFLRKYEWGKGQTGGQIATIIFVLIAFNFFGPFNIFLSRWVPSKHNNWGIQNTRAGIQWKNVSKSTSLFNNMPSKLQPILEVVSICAFWGRMIAIFARRQIVHKHYTTSQNLTH